MPMPLSVFAVVLVAAAMHAGWNAVVKASGDKVIGMAAVAAGGAVLSVAALPFVHPPALASWAFIAASVGAHVAYFALVARSYELADMSRAYPVMRGTAPLIVALAGIVVLGERLDLAAILGVLLICSGILLMATPVQRNAGLGVALLNALVIAVYTLLDGEGARRSDSPAAYVMWVFLLSGLPFLIFIVARRGREVLVDARRHLAAGLLGGAGTVGAYILVLWAMTHAPIALIASLRETAILFGLAISAWTLGEVVGRRRVVGACVMVAGAATLRLA